MGSQRYVFRVRVLWLLSLGGTNSFQTLVLVIKVNMFSQLIPKNLFWRE